VSRALTALAILATIAAMAMSPPASAQSRERTKVGTLACDISAGIGLITTSKKEVTCMFTPSRPGPREVYAGTITKFGLDVGATAGSEMVWAVDAPSTLRIGALAGHYGSVSGQATVGAGLGANELVGASDRTVTLQPVSVQGQAGLNLAPGVSGLDLRPAR
jgi:hypothetical protein